MDVLSDESLIHKLELLIDKQRSIRYTNHSEISNILSKLASLQGQLLDGLTECQSSVIKEQTVLPKAHGVIKSNSLYPSLPLKKESCESLNNLLENALGMINVYSKTKTLESLKIDTLDCALNREDRICQRMQELVLKFEQDNKDIYKFAEEFNTIKSLVNSHQINTSSSPSSVFSTSIETFHGDGVLASSSVIETSESDRNGD